MNRFTRHDGAIVTEINEMSLVRYIWHAIKSLGEILIFCGVFMKNFINSYFLSFWRLRVVHENLGCKVKTELFIYFFFLFVIFNRKSCSNIKSK